MTERLPYLAISYWPISIGSVFAFSLYCGPGADLPELGPEPDPPVIEVPVDISEPDHFCGLPDIGRELTQCYITHDTAGIRDPDGLHDATGLIQDLMILDQELVVLSRNFASAAGECAPNLGEDIPPFYVSPMTLGILSAQGFALHDGGRVLARRNTIGHPSLLSFVGEGEWMGKLEITNKRFPQSGDEWFGITDVFRPTLSDFRQSVSQLMDLMEDIDARAPAFEGVLAWCYSQ